LNRFKANLRIIKLFNDQETRCMLLGIL